MLLRLFCLVLSLVALQPCSFAFVVRSPTTRSSSGTGTWRLASTIDEKTPIEELDEERKSNLFQFLLRDLQVEGVPLLGCDADQTHILQAAMWTTMAELSDNDKADKACMIFENIPLDSLRAFVEDMEGLKAEDELMGGLPELKRFNFSLVGRGIGPAILIETGNRTQEEIDTRDFVKENTPAPDELKWTAAMKAFVSRMVVGQDVCPYTKENSVGPSGLESHGVNPGPLAYRLSGALDVCDTLSAFWNCVCELLSVTEEQLSSTILCLPPPPEGSPENEVEARFSALSRLISKSLSLYRGESVFELLHMHPTYNRQSVSPSDEFVPGHLPPTSWMRAILEQSGETEKVTNDQLELQDYQRRSPLPAVVIKRVSQLTAARQEGAAEITLEDGRLEMVRGSPYARNVIRMASEGKEALQSALDTEIAVTK